MSDRGGAFDAVVVGAGVGGLAVAVRLAAAGRRVVICERAPVVGGKLGLLERDGFRFDTGPHLLTLPDILRDTFAAGGTRLEDHLTLRRLDPLCRYRFADGTWWDHPEGDGPLFAAAERLRPGNGAELQRLMARAAAMWDATKEPFLMSPLHGVSTLLGLTLGTLGTGTTPRTPGALTTVAPWQTLSGLARSSLGDDRLVAFVERFATYTGSDPRTAPAVLASIVHAEHRFGAWYVEGGLRGIGDALLERCLALGVDVRCGTAVEEIVCVGGRAAGVRLVGGEVLRAPTVVANADAAHLYGELLRDAGRDVDRAVRPARRALARTTPSLSGLVLLLALDRRASDGTQLPEMAHHTVLFPARYHDEFDDVFGHPARPVDDPAIYVAAPDDPTLAPPGAAAWFVLVNAPRHDPTGRSGIDWRAPGVAAARPIASSTAWPSAASTCGATSAGARSARRPTWPTRPVGGRIDLRDLVERPTRRLPAPRQPLAPAGPVPRRRLVAPRRRAAARAAQRGDHGPARAGVLNGRPRRSPGGSRQAGT